MTYFLAILAGAVQGLTEFLPISSTGHLIIFEKLFNISQKDFGLAFDASLHLGTLFAVCIFFYKDYLQIFNFKNKLPRTEVRSIFFFARFGSLPWLENLGFLAQNNLLPKLIVATIPAIIFGLIFESIIESTLRQLWVVGLALILFSFVMLYAEKNSSKKKTGSNLNIMDSLIIGFAQALALIPGISRSGSTISAGLFLNLSRQEAARFAFMISGPIIAGAGLKKFTEAFQSDYLINTNLNFFIIGIISSAFFGYLTIKYFLKYLASKNLYPFIIYRIVLGLILLIFSLKI